MKTEWRGGKCPVDPDAVVTVQFRWDAERWTWEETRGSKNRTVPAKYFRWTHLGVPGDIINYEVM